VQIWIDALRGSVEQAPGAALWLFLCAVAFFALAVGVKGLNGALNSAKAAAEQTRINAILSAVDQVTVGPLLQVMLISFGLLLHRLTDRVSGLPDTTVFWAMVGPAPTQFATIFVGDFIGYWRHRAQHSRWLWPAHAVHHSDTHLTWFSLERMHPIDRIGSACDTLLLGALGFPAWALLGNVLVRHFYGYLVHADVPWTLGKANWLFNSPVMHRWHHARDPAAYDSNFATVFSVFDRAFGTYYQPGPCHAPLGVDEDMGDGAIGQYVHPLKVWLRVAKPAGPASAPQMGQPAGV